MNCKPGDMAVIVFAPLTPNILGHIVQVVGVWPTEIAPSPQWPSGIIWEIKYPDGRKIECTNEVFESRMLKSRPFNDYGLRPIRPGDLQETEDDLNEVTA